MAKIINNCSPLHKYMNDFEHKMLQFTLNQF